MFDEDLFACTAVRNVLNNYTADCVENMKVRFKVCAAMSTCETHHETHQITCA